MLILRFESGEDSLQLSILSHTFYILNPILMMFYYLDKEIRNNSNSMSVEKVIFLMLMSCIFYYLACVLSDYLTNFKHKSDTNPDKHL